MPKTEDAELRNANACARDEFEMSSTPTLPAGSCDLCALHACIPGRRDGCSLAMNGSPLWQPGLSCGYKSGHFAMMALDAVQGRSPFVIAYSTDAAGTQIPRTRSRGGYDAALAPSAKRPSVATSAEAAHAFPQLHRWAGCAWARRVACNGCMCVHRYRRLCLVPPLHTPRLLRGSVSCAAAIGAPPGQAAADLAGMGNCPFPPETCRHHLPQARRRVAPSPSAVTSGMPTLRARFPFRLAA